MTTQPGREVEPSPWSSWFGHEDGHFSSGVVSVPCSVHPAAVIWPLPTPRGQVVPHSVTQGQDPPQNPGTAVRNLAGGLGWTIQLP